jgi:hypothetical protein
MAHAPASEKLPLKVVSVKQLNGFFNCRIFAG